MAWWRNVRVGVPVRWSLRHPASSERLSAVATDSSLLVGLHGVYRQGRLSIGAEVAARQELGSSDSEYVSFLNLGLQF